MICKRIQLDEKDPSVYLDIYVANPSKDLIRNAILIIPGGGYHVVYEPEGEPVALAFMPYGYNAFVLHYSVGEKGANGVFPKQLIQASKAMKHIRDHSEEYGIDPERIFTIGFSAGGHLAASLATMWNKKEIYDAIDMEYGYNKPRGVMLGYPVISGVREDIMEKGSYTDLLGDGFSNEEKRREASPELHVTKEASPIFIVASASDEVVNAKNSLCLAEAYADQNIPYEIHIYPKAAHGFCLGNKVTSRGWDEWVDESIAKWLDNAIYWAENR